MIQQLRRTNNGSIMLVSLVFLAIFSLLVVRLYQAAIQHQALDDALIAQWQAQELALSGVEIARAQLEGRQLVKKAQGVVVDSKSQESFEKKMLRSIVPKLNQQQHFELQERFDGITGSIDFVLSSENGKININRAFDKEKGRIREPYRDLLVRLVFEDAQLARGQLLEKIEQYLVEHEGTISDISMLRCLEGLQALALHYVPKVSPGGAAAQANVALGDIFTTWSDTNRVEPWLLSHGMTVLLGLEDMRQHDGAGDLEQQMMSKMLDEFTPDLGKNWEEHSIKLTPLYGKNATSLGKRKAILTEKFAPDVYSVLSWGTVRNVVQKVQAILVRTRRSRTSPKTKSIAPYTYTIKRIVWL